MISALNLIWMIPVCISTGWLFGAFICGAVSSQKQQKAYQAGIIEGKKIKSRMDLLPHCQTLEELFDRGFDSNFNKFKEITGGVIYGAEDSGQTSIVFVDDTDILCQYYDNELLGISEEGIFRRPIVRVHTI